MKKIIFLFISLLVVLSACAQENFTIERPRELANSGTFTGAEVFVIDHPSYPDSYLQGRTATQLLGFIQSQISGGATYLGELGDIDFTNDNSNYVLKSNGDGTYRFDVDNTGTAGSMSANDLTDVSTIGWSTDKILKFNSSGNLVVANDDYTDPSTITLNVARINGNTLGGSVNYFVNPTAGDFMRCANSSGLLEWVSLSDYLPFASAAQVQSFSSSSLLLKPQNQHQITITGYSMPAAGSSISYKGLKLTRTNSTYGSLFGYEFQPTNLSVVAGTNVDPWASYFVLDDDGTPKRLGLSQLQDALGAVNNYIVNCPADWFYTPSSLAGQSYNAYTGTLKSNLTVYDYEGNQIAAYDTDFSTENEYNVSSTSFRSELGLGITMQGTVPAGTYDNDGSVLWSCDIVFTDSDGVTGRVTVGVVHPLTTSGGPGYDDPDGLFMVQIVNAWPITETEGVFFKLGDGMRYYYIDEGTCQWGYQDASGTGACITSK